MTRGICSLIRGTRLPSYFGLENDVSCSNSYLLLCLLKPSMGGRGGTLLGVTQSETLWMFMD